MQDTVESLKKLIKYSKKEKLKTWVLWFANKQKKRVVVKG